MFFKKLAPHLLRGQAGERRAAAYLKAQGLSIVANNIRSRYGEIDLIARDGAVLVFVEVRSRRAGSQVSAAASITPGKQAKSAKPRLLIYSNTTRSRPIAALMPFALTARKSRGSKEFSEILAGAGAICYGTNRPLTQAKRSG